MLKALWAYFSTMLASLGIFATVILLALWLSGFFEYALKGIE